MACLQELRTREVIARGAASTPHLRYGDSVEIEMLDEAGESLFGRIAQSVAAP